MSLHLFQMQLALNLYLVYVYCFEDQQPHYLVAKQLSELYYQNWIIIYYMYFTMVSKLAFIEAYLQLFVQITKHSYEFVHLLHNECHDQVYLHNNGGKSEAKPQNSIIFFQLNCLISNIIYSNCHTIFQDCRYIFIKILTSNLENHNL